MNLKSLSIIGLITISFLAAISCNGQTKKNKLLKERYKRKDTVVIDVRTEEEFKEEHFQNSVNIPLSDIGNQEIVDRLKDYENIITICRSGRRSGKAMEILQGKGFESVYNGGGWKSFATLVYE